MAKKSYHYFECGLTNIYLLNGYKIKKTARGEAISIHDVDGLHKAIGLFLVTSKKDLSGQEIRFLRHEMLMSQMTLAELLGVSEQAVHRWEKGKTTIPKPSESLLRLLYKEHAHDKSGTISAMLKEIADLEDHLKNKPILFKDTTKGWRTTAA